MKDSQEKAHWNHRTGVASTIYTPLPPPAPNNAQQMSTTGYVECELEKPWEIAQ